MPLIVQNVKLPLDAAFSSLGARIAQKLEIPEASIRAVRIVRESVDARKKREICKNIHALVHLDAHWQNKVLKSDNRDVKLYEAPPSFELPNCNTPKTILIVGFGPAGLFSAYFLAKHGYCPIVIERGKSMDERTKDVENFFSSGTLNENSNVMFGEGGAGTFSDGKLTSRSKDIRVATVLDTFVSHGAPEDVAYLAKPHIGTDVLRQVIANMRKEIIRMGGEVRFETTLTGFIKDDNVLRGVNIMNEGKGETIACDACILAIGQGARDTYEMLHEQGIAMEAKAFAVGVRIEHPQRLIDVAQYGDFAGHESLGAADYRLVGKSGSRGVYTFCMCPGGVVVASSSSRSQVVVNGMSYRARDGENANSALVVQVSPEDFGNHPLDGMRYQQQLEEKAFMLGGGDYLAPAQRVEDFILGRATENFGKVNPTYQPGVRGTSLSRILPDYIEQGIRDGLTQFAKQIKGYDMADAVLTGVETRTSAPLRILRDEMGESINLKGLYPVGEGAGYAGGIVSAAVDGLRAAQNISQASV